MFEQLVSAELQTEALAISLQLGTFNVLLPALAQNVFHATHIRVQLALNLRAHNNPHMYICTKSTVKFEKIKRHCPLFILDQVSHLFGPNDGARHGRQVTNMTHATRLALRIALLELLMQ